MLTDTDGPPRPFLVPVAVIPGCAHALLGRPRRGLALFVLATGAANLAALSAAAPVAPLGEASYLAGLFLAATTVVWSILDAAYIGVWLRRPVARTRRREAIEKAERALGEGDRVAARAALEAALTPDRGDPALRVLLAGLEREAGRPDIALEHARAGLKATRKSRFQAALEREVALALEARGGR